MKRYYYALVLIITLLVMMIMSCDKCNPRGTYDPCKAPVFIREDTVSSASTHVDGSVTYPIAAIHPPQVYNRVNSTISFTTYAYFPCYRQVIYSNEQGVSIHQITGAGGSFIGAGEHVNSGELNFTAGIENYYYLKVYDGPQTMTHSFTIMSNIAVYSNVQRYYSTPHNNVYLCYVSLPTNSSATGIIRMKTTKDLFTTNRRFIVALNSTAGNRNIIATNYLSNNTTSTQEFTIPNTGLRHHASSNLNNTLQISVDGLTNVVYTPPVTFSSVRDFSDCE